MNYYFNYFNLDTIKDFNKTDQTRDGVAMDKFKYLCKNEFGPGDKLIAYVGGLKKFAGVVEVIGELEPDSNPRYEGDKYLLQYPIKKIVWLSLDKAMSLKDSKLWNQLSFTCGKPKNVLSYWFLPAPRLCKMEDGVMIEKILLELA